MLKTVHGEAVVLALLGGMASAADQSVMNERAQSPPARFQVGESAPLSLVPWTAALAQWMRHNSVRLVGIVDQSAAQSDEPASVDVRRGMIAPAAQVQLTADQRAAIVNAVRPADTKLRTRENVPTAVGAQVPPQTELYFLPDQALASAPEVKGIKYIVARNRVVLVDPTTMRVVDVIP